MFKKRILLVLGIILAISAILPTTMSDIKYAEADGKAEIAMELTQGRVLHEKNADCAMPMASTTKIMTALLVAQDCNLDEIITVPDEAVGVEGSSIYLKRGETLSVRDLLYGLMLRSGNDAATALAIHHSGSIDKFVEAMNFKAKEIGANNTHFANPSGLPDDNHYTTARDLCEIARYAMLNDTFAEVVACKNYSGDFRTFTNKNKILSTVEGANGIKTGYTAKAGRCLVSSARRDGMDVICVVLNCYDMYERSSKIIESSFGKYCMETLTRGRVFDFNGRRCALDKDYTLCLERGEEIEYELTDVKDNPNCGSAIAELHILSSKGLIFSAFLYNI